MEVSGYDGFANFRCVYGVKVGPFCIALPNNGGIVVVQTFVNNRVLISICYIMIAEHQNGTNIPTSITYKYLHTLSDSRTTTGN